ncbi:MAG TPA: hypothetical protein VHY79_09865 [Rhizomicrobium sp.]|jgi:hypothetical protein|nr:hypothetical protein [Rhizomicrobium sp.]
MDIHKPKSVHNWRELAKEIGIIVIGVLIALGAEQAVDALHWMNQVDAGNTALKAAFVREVKNSALRASEHDCIVQRLAFLSQVVQQASGSGRLPPIAALGHPPFVPWTIGTWEALVTSGTVSHLPRDAMIRYTTIAQRSAFLSGLSDREEAQWTVLDTMVGPGRRLSDVEAEQLRITLAEAADSNRFMRTTSGGLRDAVRATGLLQPSDFAQADRLAAIDRKNAAICHPLASATAGK